MNAIAEEEIAPISDRLEPEGEYERSSVRAAMRSIVDAQAPARRRIGFALWLTMFVIVAITAALTWRGWDFYRLGTDARLDHPDYRVLTPTGLVGQGYGVVGTGLILLNLLYLVRRRLAWLPVGSMTFWLNLHVFTGLTGTVLIIFHSAFRLRSPVAAVTAASLLAVVLTGLVGRYLYALSPNIGQLKLEDRLRELETILPTFAATLRARLAERPATQLRADPSLLLVLFTVPRWLLDARRRRRIVRAVAREDQQLARLRRREPEWVTTMTRETAAMAARDVDAIAGSALLRTWRSIHRFMAILMLLAVAIHIGVAWHYGYRWLLSQ